MIKIRLSEIDYGTCTPPEDPFNWLRWLDLSFCYANQFVEADGFRYADECPSLSFARNIKSIAYRLKYRKESGQYMHQLAQNEFYLSFNSDGDFAIIESKRQRDDETINSIRVSTDEILESANRHFDNVIVIVSPMIPEVLADAFVIDWLNVSLHPPFY